MLSQYIIAIRTKITKMPHLKFFGFLLLAYTVSANDFKKIENITGEVSLIQTDSESNLYVYVSEVITENDGNTYDVANLYKLSPEKEIIFKTNINNVQRLLITKSNDVYITVIDFHKNEMLIYFLKANSTLPLKIAQFNIELFTGTRIPYFSILDQKGNLIFNAPTGTAMFKLGDRAFLSIVNLENFYTDGCTVDASNNILLHGKKYPTEKIENGVTFGAFIAPDQLGIVPSAKTFRISGHLDNYLYDSNEYENQMILVLNGRHSRLMAVEMGFYVEPEFKVLHAQPSSTYDNSITAKNYFYFYGKMDDFCFLGFIQNSSRVQHVNLERVNEQDLWINNYEKIYL